MALADTGTAIGRVTDWLRERLQATSGNIMTTVGRPQPPNGADNLPKPRLNIFLYEASFDPSMRNLPVYDRQPPPLWLTLKYVLTAFDSDGDSDTAEALDLMGLGLRALQELSYLLLRPTAPAATIKALQDNPEPLKITFDEASAELLSKLMQGTDERYRFSMAFQVRPVMIATAEPPAYSLLVGVDYTATPPKVIGEEGIGVEVIPSLGPVLKAVQPARFEAGESVVVQGDDMHLSGLSVRLGDVELPAAAQAPDRLTFVADGSVSAGTAISAGSHALRVVQALSSGRTRGSNLLVAELLPTVTGATASGLAGTTPQRTEIFGDIQLTGLLLGRETDDVYLALFRDGKVVRMFDLTAPAGTDQTSLVLSIPEAQAVPAGTYRVIVRVNGQQARNSPAVDLV
jgi:hypothetical protein